ncbi:type II toxin-antitoxin system death-on-curing family toxin [Rothia terrae]|uniref:Type II toxin-antitoxin system death-on-curing family toxin n=1 Tax=Rothia terrae TaxID=396015 RepID=A0A7H2BAV8_9MICC|nr:type II toxin-antitoxin system death-on-curing family toxin [Rothia terrae]QNV36804.1 type II toxin-antitoxin system death-on-curing family toxin [Rothia terrae]
MIEYEYLTLDQVVTIHDSKFKCSFNENLLASAVGKPQASFMGYERYPTLLDKAAALLIGLATNHAFADGNKRTAISCCQIFLYINGVDIDPTLDDEAIANFTVRVVEEKLPHEDVVQGLAKFYGI